MQAQAYERTIGKQGATRIRMCHAYHGLPYSGMEHWMEGSLARKRSPVRRAAGDSIGIWKMAEVRRNPGSASCIGGLFLTVLVTALLT
jgi:hypothetical protein